MLPVLAHFRKKIGGGEVLLLLLFDWFFLICFSHRKRKSLFRWFLHDNTSMRSSKPKGKCFCVRRARQTFLFSSYNWAKRTVKLSLVQIFCFNEIVYKFNIQERSFSVFSLFVGYGYGIGLSPSLNVVSSEGSIIVFLVFKLIHQSIIY